MPADSHVYVQGQASYKPSSSSPPTTTVPVPTSSTSTTVIGAGGSVNFPVTPVPDQAAAFVRQAGLVKSASMPLYHYPFGVPFQIHMVVDAADPWAAAVAPTIHDELEDAGFDTTMTMASSATNAGELLAAGWADLALMPQTFSPYPSQMLAWYTSNLGPPGKNGSENWTGFSDPQFDQLVLTASRQLSPNAAATDYQQADTRLLGRNGLAPALPGAKRTRLEQDDRWGDADTAERQSALVRAAVGGPPTGVHEQHHAVIARPVGRSSPDQPPAAPARPWSGLHCGALTFSDA